MTLLQWMKIILTSRHTSVSNPDTTRRITRATLALFIGSLLHLVTLPGSSFVEEEHQIWHFLTASTCFFLFVAFLRTIANVQEKNETKTSSSLYDAQFDEYSSLLRLRKDPSKEAWRLEKNVTNKEASALQIPDNLLPHKLPTIKQKDMNYVGVALLLVIIHRLTRAWNQTGIKYADLSDIGELMHYT